MTAITANQVPVFAAPRATSQQAPTTEPAPAPPQDTVDPAPPRDSDDKVTWGKAFRGLACAIPSAVITGVGCTASALVNDVPATISASKAIWNTPHIGPNLKTMSFLLLPVATVAAPILTAIGATGYGLYSGFARGVEEGFGKAITGAGEDVKKFHTDMAGKLVESLGEIEHPSSLPDDHQPFDIPVSKAAKGLVGAAIGGAITGVGATAIVGLHALPGAVRLGAELWKSDTALPLKTVGTVLIPPAVPLAVGLAPVGGVLAGVFFGAKDAYTKGFGEAIGNSFSNLGKLHDAAVEGIYK